MEGFYGGYALVGLVLLVGVVLRHRGLRANRLLRPTVPGGEKGLTYECGVDPVGEGWAQTHVRYYVYAYLYVVFAVDAIFLFPWATVFAAPGSASTTLVEMFVFLGFLARRAALRLAQGGAGVDGRPARARPLGPPSGGAAAARARADAAGPQLGPPLQPVGLQLRPGLLRDRVHRLLDVAARLHPARRHPVRARPAPGRPDGRLRHGHRQDGAGGQAALRADARAQVRHLASAPAPTPAAPTGTPTASPRASTRSSRSTSTCPAARRAPRRCCRASSSCRRRSPPSRWPTATAPHAGRAARSPSIPGRGDDA